MKTIRLFAMAAAVCTILFACTQVIEPETVIEEQPEATTPAINPGVFALTLSMPETKTVFGDKGVGGYHKNWSVGDKIFVNDKESDPLTAEQGADTNTATFTFETNGAPSGSTYNVVYPSSAYDSGTGKVTIPATQTYVENSFDPAADIILGSGTTPDGITLYNAVAYLKIKLKSGDYGNFGVSTITLSAAGKKLNGAFDIADGYTGLTVPVSTEVSSEATITLSVDGVTSLNDTPKEFLIAVAPQTLGSFSVTVTDPKGNTMVKTRSSEATLPAGKILPQAAFKFQEYQAIDSPEALLAFAAAAPENTNYWLVTNDIDMADKTWIACGTADSSAGAFNGVFDGGNKGTEDGGCKISNLNSTTGAFINYLYSAGVVKNVTLDSTCSIGYSADITSSFNIGGIVGMSRGTVTHCYSRATVSCSSTTYTNSIYIGGIVGRQYRSGTIDYCYNYGDVTCYASGGTTPIDIGGIVGIVVRNKYSTDNASINNCTSTGIVDRGTVDATTCQSVTHVGGVIGRIQTVAASAKLSMSGLVHETGKVSGPEQTVNYKESETELAASKAVSVGGLIGGIHGSSLDETAGEVQISASHVRNCNVYNGHWNNSGGYAEADHTGGFVGQVRGTDSSQSIIFDENSTVENVAVSNRRGYLGGFASWARGTKFDHCHVLSSSVVTAAQSKWAGGIAACAYDAIISNCDVTLTKNATYSLRTRGGGNYYTGGIVGWLRGTSSISSCRAYVTNLTQDGASGKEGYRAFIAGCCDDTSSILNCGLGGNYKGSDAITSVDGNIYGSASSATMTASENVLWDGTL